MIWSTHCLLARRAALPESSLAVSEFLDKWRLGEVVSALSLALKLLAKSLQCPTTIGSKLSDEHQKAPPRSGCLQTRSHH